MWDLYLQLAKFKGDTSWKIVKIISRNFVKIIFLRQHRQCSWVLCMGSSIFLYVAAWCTAWDSTPPPLPQTDILLYGRFCNCWVFDSVVQSLLMTISSIIIPWVLLSEMLTLFSYREYILRRFHIFCLFFKRENIKRRNKEYKKRGRRSALNLFTLQILYTRPQHSTSNYVSLWPERSIL